jgi:YD repeat-containing protein
MLYVKILDTNICIGRRLRLRRSVATITDALQHRTALTYKAQGNLTQVTDGNGNSQSCVYDSQGRRTAMTGGQYGELQP